MNAFSHAVLATAALVVQAALLALAPGLEGLAENVRRLVARRAPVPAFDPYHRLEAALLSSPLDVPGEGRIAACALAIALAATILAFLLVPSFLAGSLLAPFGDLLTVASLLMLARFASLVALAAGGRSETIPALLGAMRIVGLFLPAMLLASLASALLGGPRLDMLANQLRAGSAVPGGLAAAAVALIAIADLEAGGAREALEIGAAGPALALARAVSAIRLLVWLDVTALFLPPWRLPAATDGPIAWIGALLLWAARVALLACLLGAGRAVFAAASARRAGALLGGASLLGLLASVFVVIGQSFE